MTAITEAHFFGAMWSCDSWRVVKVAGLTRSFDVTPGLIDDRAIGLFTGGQCHSLAIAISERTGWPLYGVGADECGFQIDCGGYDDIDGLCPCQFDHLVVQTPEGDFLDIEGVHTLEGLVNHYDFSPYETAVRPVTAGHLEHIKYDTGALRWVQRDEAIVAEFVDVVLLLRIGITPFQIAEVHRIRDEVVAAGEVNSTGGPSCGVTSEEAGGVLHGSEFYGAYLTDDGRKVAHAWVELADGGIIDSTSDQFGGPRISYISAEDPRRSRYLDEAGDDWVSGSTGVVESVASAELGTVPVEREQRPLALFEL